MLPFHFGMVLPSTIQYCYFVGILLKVISMRKWSINARFVLIFSAKMCMCVSVCVYGSSNSPIPSSNNIIQTLYIYIIQMACYVKNKLKSLKL